MAHLVNQLSSINMAADTFNYCYEGQTLAEHGCKFFVLPCNTNFLPNPHQVLGTKHSMNC